MKNKWLQIRVTEDQLEDRKKWSEKLGYRSVAGFVLDATEREAKEKGVLDGENNKE